MISTPVPMRTTPTLGSPAGFGRVVAYDTSFNVTVQNATATTLLYSAGNFNMNIYVSAGAIAGTYVQAAYDLLNATTNMTLSAEL